MKRTAEIVPRGWVRSAEIALLLGLAACGGGAGVQQPAPVKPAPARPGGFAVPADVGALVVDARAFGEAARGWRDALAAPAASADAAKQQIFVTALLDALDGRWPESLAGIDRVAAMETDPAEKAMVGLTIRVWADAIAHEGDTPEAFRAALDRQLATLPIDSVRPHLSMLRTMSQVFTPAVCRQLVASEIGPRAKRGTIGLTDVHAVAFQRYAVVRLVPVAAILDAALAARGIDPIPQ